MSITSKKRFTLALVQLSVSSVVIGLPVSASTVSLSDVGEVVFVSMADRGDFLYWPKGEKHIQSELRLSGLQVMIVKSTPADGLDFEDVLEREAGIGRVRVALTIYKHNNKNARLLIYWEDHNAASDRFLKLNYGINSEGDDADIAALEATEAVRAFANRKTLLDGPEDVKPAVSLATVVAVAASSVACFGAAVVFHSMMYVHRKRANGYAEIYNKGINYESVNAEQMVEPINDREHEKKRSQRYQIGAIVGYILGGGLAVASSVLFYEYKNSKERKEGSLHVYISPANAGLTLEF